MSRIVAFLWSYLFCWLASATLHVVDADVGSVRGLGDLSVLLSVSVAAALLLVPVLMGAAVQRRDGWRRFFAVMAAVAGDGSRHQPPVDDDANPDYNYPR